MGLARSIPLSVKEKMWRNEYIDIFTLLEVRAAGLDLKADKEEDEDKKRVRVERNIATGVRHSGQWPASLSKSTQSA